MGSSLGLVRLVLRVVNGLPGRSAFGFGQEVSFFGGVLLGFWVGFLRVMVMVRLPLWVVFWVDFLRVKMGVTLPVKSLCGMGLLHEIFGTGWRGLPSSHQVVS